MAKTKYDERTRDQIASDVLKEKGLFGTIGTYLSGDFPQSESLKDPQGRVIRRQKGMDILKQRQAEGKKRAAELKRKKEQQIRKNKAARILAQRKKEGEERAARLRKEKEQQIAKNEEARKAGVAAREAMKMATGESAKQKAMSQAVKRAKQAESARQSTGVLRSSANPAKQKPKEKPKIPAKQTASTSGKPAGKTSSAPAKSATKSPTKLTGEKKYNFGVSKGGVPFREAFKYFRAKSLKGGDKVFTWNGKRYTTDLKKPAKKMGGGMMKSKMASKGGAKGGKRMPPGMKNGGSASKFPDLSGDGKVTQKDILMGKGVIGGRGLPKKPAKPKAGGRSSDAIKKARTAKMDEMKDRLKASKMGRAKMKSKGGTIKKPGGMQTGGMMKSKGMAKGGAMKKKGYAMGGSVKKKGMAKGGAMKKKGYAMGGMTKKGMAKGGAMTKKGMAKGGTNKKRAVSRKPRGVGAALRGFGKALKK